VLSEPAARYWQANERRAAIVGKTVSLRLVAALACLPLIDLWRAVAEPQPCASTVLKAHSGLDRFVGLRPVCVANVLGPTPRTTASLPRRSRTSSTHWRGIWVRGLADNDRLAYASPAILSGVRQHPLAPKLDVGPIRARCALSDDQLGLILDLPNLLLPLCRNLREKALSRQPSDANGIGMNGRERR
jgi:hypothetical protein